MLTLSYPTYPIIILSLGYLTLSVCRSFRNDNKNVTTPILPININIIKINLLKTEISLVIPKDNPTVPNADVLSNKISVIEKGSIIDIIRRLIKTNAIAIIITVTALSKSSSYISLLKTLIFFPPRAYVIIKMITRANVVVRVPPPALLGEAPININNDKNS